MIQPERIFGLRKGRSAEARREVTVRLPSTTSCEPPSSVRTDSTIVFGAITKMEAVEFSTRAEDTYQHAKNSNVEAAGERRTK